MQERHDLLTLTIPGYGNISAPDDVPTGGISQGSEIIQLLLTLVFITAIVVALFMLIYSGLQYIQSGGDKQKIEAARHRIVFTIIGLVVVFLSFMIVNMVGYFFGINLLGFSANNGTQGGRQEQRETRREREEQSRRRENERRQRQRQVANRPRNNQ